VHLITRPYIPSQTQSNFLTLRWSCARTTILQSPFCWLRNIEAILKCEYAGMSEHSHTHTQDSVTGTPTEDTHPGEQKRWSWPCGCRLWRSADSRSHGSENSCHLNCPAFGIHFLGFRRLPLPPPPRLSFWLQIKLPYLFRNPFVKLLCPTNNTHSSTQKFRRARAETQLAGHFSLCKYEKWIAFDCCWIRIGPTYKPIPSTIC